MLQMKQNRVDTNTGGFPAAFDDVPLSGDSGEKIRKRFNTILIVDDLNVNRQILRILLSRIVENCIFIFASNGKEAVEQCRKNPKIDLVFMNNMMPVMDGLKATVKIKQRGASFPIILTSVFPKPSIQKEAFSAGCVDVLRFPVNQAVLYEIVSMYL